MDRSRGIGLTANLAIPRGCWRLKRIFPVVLALIAALCLAGCGPKAESGPKPEEVFDGYMAALKAFDFDKAKEYLAEDANPDLMLDLSNLGDKEQAILPALKVWMGRMEISNVQTQDNGSTATITFDLAMPDLQAVQKKAMAAVTSQETIMELVQKVQAEQFTSVEEREQRFVELTIETTVNKLIEAMQDPDVEMSTQSGEADLVKTQAGWKLTELRVDLNAGLNLNLAQ